MYSGVVVVSQRGAACALVLPGYENLSRSCELTEFFTLILIKQDIDKRERETLAWRNLKEFAAFVATMSIKKYMYER